MCKKILVKNRMDFLFFFKILFHCRNINGRGPIWPPGLMFDTSGLKGKTDLIFIPV